MWRQAGSIVGRLLGWGGRTGGSAADELRSMGSRELSDLGIGAGEVPYVLEGGGRGRSAEARIARRRDERRTGAEQMDERAAGTMPARI